ncbi:MAG: pantoate--beta-alanine ligase [Bryobacteraceae bacterium]
MIFRTIAEVRAEVARARGRGLSIGLVPTMGALHAGHGALIQRAKAETGYVVATIFVNPAQFDRAEDFEKYPRSLQTDLEFCERMGVDAVFAPEPAEMYPERLLTAVEVSEVSSGLEGEFRPGHFRGVATVVAKLFHVIPADRAYFGEKDAHQLAVIRRMVADLNFPVEVVPVATVREADGLAISSRNQRLTPEDRLIAPALYRGLREAEALIRGGCDSPAAARQAVLKSLQPEMRAEYVEVVDPLTMLPVEKIDGRALIAAAVWMGGVRLIDNVRVSEKR